MRKDITTNILIDGGEKINKSALARQYGCCWETIDRRLNPDKYKKERKVPKERKNLFFISLMYRFAITQRLRFNKNFKLLYI